jgi:hypothetical protein
VKNTPYHAFQHLWERSQESIHTLKEFQTCSKKHFWQNIISVIQFRDLMSKFSVGIESGFFLKKKGEKS